MKHPSVITGRNVLFGLLGFFGVIIAVNSAFVFFALDSWPGLTTDKAYEEGRDYNRTLTTAEAQAALGWESSVTLVKYQDRHQLRSVFSDATGAPLGGLVVRAVFRRPVGPENELEIALPEITPGEYLSPVLLPLAGRWQVSIEAGSTETVDYHMLYVFAVEQ